MENICFSGGAEGADLEWGNVAKKNGHEVRHFVFANHKGSDHPDAVVVTPEELEVGDRTLELANEILGRSFPAHSNYVTNLLRRNFWQVVDSDAVYAVAGLDPTKDNKVLIGGTAWAVECFKILHPDSDRIFVYDSWKDQWYRWTIAAWPSFEKVSRNEIPKPSGKWTGIGSRDLDSKGREAIRGIFD